MASDHWHIQYNPEQQEMAAEDQQYQVLPLPHR